MTALNVWPGDDQYHMINKADAHDVIVDHQDGPEMEQRKNYMRKEKRLKLSVSALDYLRSDTLL